MRRFYLYDPGRDCLCKKEGRVLKKGREQIIWVRKREGWVRKMEGWVWKEETGQITWVKSGGGEMGEITWISTLRGYSSKRGEVDLLKVYLRIKGEGEITQERYVIECLSLMYTGHCKDINIEKQDKLGRTPMAATFWKIGEHDGLMM